MREQEKQPIKEYKIQDIYVYQLPIPALLWVPAWIGGVVFAGYFGIPLFVLLVVIGILLVFGIFLAMRTSPLRRGLLFALILVSFLGGYLYHKSYTQLPHNHISIVAAMSPSPQPEQSKYISKDSSWQASPYQPTDQREHIQQKITGRIVSSARKAGERYVYTLDLLSMADFEIQGRVSLFVDSDAYKYGDIVQGVVRIVESQMSNPGARDYARTMRQEGLFGTAYTVSPLVILGGADERSSPLRVRFFSRIYSVRDYIREKLRTYLPYSSPTAISMVLGERQYLDEYGDDFRSETLPRSGLMHLFAISGLHIGILAFMLVSIFKIFPFGRVFGAVITIFLLIFYAFLGGLAPPVVRAVIFFSFFIIARVSDLPISRWQVLVMSFFFISLLNPLLLTSISLQYSFVAFAGIVLGEELFSRHIASKIKGRKRSLWKSLLYTSCQYLCMSLCIQTLILPLSIYYFNTINLNAVFANTIGIGLMGLLLPLYFLVAILPAGFFLFSFIQVTAEFGTEVFNQMTEMFSRFPFVWEYHQSLPQLLTMLSLLFIGLIFIAYHRNRKWLYQGIIVCLLALCFLSKVPQEKDFAIVFFDAGNADVTLVRFSQGDYMLVDTGEFARATKNISQHLVPYLKQENVSRIQKVILTHQHSDHYSGIFYLGEHIQIDTLMVSQRFFDSVIGQRLRYNQHFADTAFYVIADTLTYRHKDYTIKFLHPDRDYRSLNENNHSLVFRLSANDLNILFTGDIEGSAERYILRKYAEYLPSDIMKAAHHGSRTSSQAVFVESVNPELFVITASGNVSRGFPSTITLQTAEDIAKKTFITGVHGAIMVETNK